jgi:CBS domain-containing protein
MNVLEVMTKELETCNTDDSLALCAEKMKRLDIGSLPVVDGSGSLVGIITDRDITVRAVAAGVSVAEAKAGDFMTPSPLTVTPAMNVEDAADIMAANQIRRLPVVQDGTLQGIVSLGDLAVMTEEKVACHALHDVSIPIHQK